MYPILTVKKVPKVSPILHHRVAFNDENSSFLNESPMSWCGINFIGPKSYFLGSNVYLWYVQRI